MIIETSAHVLELLEKYTRDPSQYTYQYLRDEDKSEPDYHTYVSPEEQQVYVQELRAIPHFAKYGKIFKSSVGSDIVRVPQVACARKVKHVFPEAGVTVLQYDITNTLKGSAMHNVSIDMVHFVPVTIPCPQIKPGETGTVYVSIPFLFLHSTSLKYDIHSSLKFSRGSTGNKYEVHELEQKFTFLPALDYCVPMQSTDFFAIYDALPYKCIGHTMYDQTIQGLVKKFAQRCPGILFPLEGFGCIPANATSHELKLLGQDANGGKVAMLVKLSLVGGKVVASKRIRATNEGPKYIHIF